MYCKTWYNLSLRRRTGTITRNSCLKVPIPFLVYTLKLIPNYSFKCELKTSFSSIFWDGFPVFNTNLANALWTSLYLSAKPLNWLWITANMSLFWPSWGPPEKTRQIKPITTSQSSTDKCFLAKESKTIVYSHSLYFIFILSRKSSYCCRMSMQSLKTVISCNFIP